MMPRRERRAAPRAVASLCCRRRALDGRAARSYGAATTRRRAAHSSVGARNACRSAALPGALELRRRATLAPGRRSGCSAAARASARSRRAALARDAHDGLRRGQHALARGASCASSASRRAARASFASALRFHGFWFAAAAASGSIFSLSIDAANLEEKRECGAR
jgi:hypothetical protein